MNDQGQTLIKNPANGAERTFTFDHSYWSHEPGTAEDVDNTVVYATLGTRRKQHSTLAHAHPAARRSLVARQP